MFRERNFRWLFFGGRSKQGAYHQNLAASDFVRGNWMVWSESLFWFIWLHESLL